MIEFSRNSLVWIGWIALVCVGSPGCSSPTPASGESAGAGGESATLGFGSALGGGSPAGGGIPVSSSTESGALTDDATDAEFDSVAFPEPDEDTVTGDGDSSAGEPSEENEEDGPKPFAYECNVGEVEECETECGSIGTRLCNKIWEPLRTPEEVCNGEDDDCNGHGGRRSPGTTGGRTL